MKNIDNLLRCTWCDDSLIYQQYHDFEWGKPIYDDQKLFELLSLEGAQAGLSWLTILKRRDSYRQTFDNFNIKKVARYDIDKINELLNNPQIIRNKLKIQSVIRNAKAVIKIQKKYGSFDNYLQKYSNQIINISKARCVAEHLSLDLKLHGMRFVGPTICLAFMQSSGMFNDHQANCFRYKQIRLS